MTRRIAPVAVAALAVAAYFVVDPDVPDLPAAQYRTWLFAHDGFTLWNNGWYAGHHTPGYSILFPPLAAWLGGPEVIGALSALAMAAMFGPLIEHHFGPRAARWSAVWFGAAAATPLWAGRLPWSLGAAFGIAAMLALQRDRVALAIAAALAATLSSPVAGAFVALAGAAVFLTASRARGAALVVAGLAPSLILTVLFPEGGTFPFAVSSYWFVPVACLGAAALFPAREGTLRAGAVLYALGATAALILDTAFGGNAVRLGQLVGGPLVLAALVAYPRRTGPARIAAIALVVLLGWWQLGPLVRDVRKTINDPATQASYFAPLNAFLAAHHTTGRVEIPTLRSQAESYYVAKRFPLARGWERQLDRKYNGDLFYDGNKPTPATYERFLTENEVEYVALPDAALDYAGKSEGKLLETGLPYLRAAGTAGHWRIFAFHPPRTFARLTSEGVEGVKPGVVRVRWSPYWRLTNGCVERAGDWTRVEPRGAGPERLEMAFRFARGRRCDLSTR